MGVCAQTSRRSADIWLWSEAAFDREDVRRRWDCEETALAAERDARSKCSSSSLSSPQASHWSWPMPSFGLMLPTLEAAW